MTLHTIDTGFFKLDGGAMFGVVPKSIWQKQNPADENNLCTWAMRCLLVENGKQLILIDTGCGNKQDASFFRHYYLHGEATLISSIQKAGFSPDEITDVILTHLHFDHVGGAVSCNADKTHFFPTFKNAKYWTNQKQWDWAMNPNAREKASFLKENLIPLQESGQLHPLTPEGGIAPKPPKGALIENRLKDTLQSELPDSPFGGWGAFLFVNGHTEAMMLPRITFQEKTFVFVADLIPSVGHIPVPYVMGYDVRPLETMKEKSEFLQQALDNQWILIFEHDPVIECATLINTERGIRAGNKGKIVDFFMK